MGGGGRILAGVDAAAIGWVNAAGETCPVWLGKPTTAHWGIPDPATVQGTDIDKRMVERAKNAIFSDEDARGVPVADMERGFDRVPGGWRAKDVLRRMTDFQVGDLLRVSPRAGAYELVMCRNTVIYFAEPIRDELHGRLAHSLRSGGYLVVGATERVAKPAELGLEMAHPFIYRKA